MPVTLQDMVLTPKIMGKVTGMGPAAILLSLSIWGALFGVIGMILALPLTTLGISYYKHYIVKQSASPAPKSDKPGRNSGPQAKK
jgi:predicted PurR-regulated permease PerM